MATSVDRAPSISLPKGGGAQSGIGEKFSPDAHTGTGNLSVPIAVPPGRGGLQPDLALLYSSGSGNGPFGLGWSLSVPGVSRKTSRGIPRYDDANDVFILSGAEDLVPIETRPDLTRYRPRTEGVFADIVRRHGPAGNYWEVRTTSGLKSVYGSENALGNDPATVSDPSARTRIFEWRLTRTEDLLGNRIEYEYERDSAREGPRHWDQLYLKRIRYLDFDAAGATRFLASVEFEYVDRTPFDPFSQYRSGFEIRTRRRCSRIVTRTHAGEDRDVRAMELRYADQQGDAAHQPLNKVSLLAEIQVIGVDGAQTERMPPLGFAYSNFRPDRRDFSVLRAPEWPAASLADSNLELIDLFGNGLPSLLEMNGRARYWRNLGDGRFDVPRFMKDAPTDISLADAGVQLLDATGDGRADLLVTSSTMSGYFPLTFSGQWDRRSFRRFPLAPTFDLADPEVKLVDLDGDGVTDAIRSSTRLECFFHDPEQGWHDTRWVERQALEVFPNVSFSDPRVKWGDFTGDGLQSIGLIHDGSVEYWPNLGYGRWGERIHMRRAPHFPYDYDPHRLLVGDVDGDGLADLVYVNDDSVRLWINQSGNSWSDPIDITGTPSWTVFDDVRLADVLGSGIEGALWSRANERDRVCFLDFTGGRKPYLLEVMDNHLGAVTRIEYAPSTRYYIEDQAHPETRWRTKLPFPVHVVARVENIDYFSRGKLTMRYQYHDGHWDGAEREFRGFGRVEQFDSESFEDYSNGGVGGGGVFALVERKYFSPPTRTSTWFHLGPVGDETGDWFELDRSDQYWRGDPHLLGHTQAVNAVLSAIPPSPDARRIRRDALRSLRGSRLRTETYAIDGSQREERPYSVTEWAYGIVEFDAPAAADAARSRVFYPHPTLERTTQWERGTDPLTRISHTRYAEEDGTFDAFGRALVQMQIGCPRGWRGFQDRPAEPYLVARTRNEYATPDDAVYIHDRVARTTLHEVVDTAFKTVAELMALGDSGPELRINGQTRTCYDGDAFVGLPLGRAGTRGVVTRSETLALTDEILQRAYGELAPPYIGAAAAPAWTADYPADFRTLVPRTGGYLFRAGGASVLDVPGYFILSSRFRYDFQSGPGSRRGLVLESLDPLHDAGIDPGGHRTQFEYDAYQLLPQKITDAVGLTTQAVYDYRLLQPREVTDANGNRSTFTFSPLGLLKNSFVRGKADDEGDGLRPSIHQTCDFLAFENSSPAARQPAGVRTIRRVYHDSDPDAARDETITTVEYWDGRGRALQTRTQAEDVYFGDEHFGGGATVLPAAPAEGAGGDIVGRRTPDAAAPHVVVSGWRIYDNKGRVVEQYEPFFSTGWDYFHPGESHFGEKTTSFYDPRGRVVRTVNADGSQQRTVYGVPGTIVVPDVSDPDAFEPTSWESYSYDANDNAGRTHAGAASVYQHHWNTPASVRVDALGRAVLTIARNRDPPVNPGDPLEPMVELTTRATYDIRGNVLTQTDALGRVAFEYVYDLVNRNLRTVSIDAGVHTAVPDALGSIVEQRDSKGALLLQSFDLLNRSIRLWARDRAGELLTLRGKREYGDGGSAAQPAAEREANRAGNRLGRMIRHFDEAGVVEVTAYDFKGNLLEKTRRVVGDSAVLDAFQGAAPAWTVAPFVIDWTNPAAVPLEANVHACSLRYDALRRVTTATCPADLEGMRRRVRPRYNRAGALESVALERDGPGGAAVADVFVERIAYNAKGQRVLAAYGNGVMTRLAYDPTTFRLARVRSERYNKPSEIAYHPAGEPLQDFTCAYDVGGNTLALRFRTPDCGIVDSLLGRDALDRAFSYDALYRLRSASGRECDLPPDEPWNALRRPTDVTRTRAYTETYSYDVVGNLLTLAHANGAGAGNRVMSVLPGTNRLQSVTHGAVVFAYQSDPCGNMTAETASRHFEWDHANRLRVFRTQLAGSEPTAYAHSFYDAAGRPIKKLVRKPGGIVEVTVYIDGIFERHRVTRKGQVEQNDTLHLLDGARRIAEVRVGNAFDGDATPAIKFHFADHLDSSSLVVDGGGNPVNTEEYTPFGDTSFGSFRYKRYRFGGQERDEASGLYAFGARHYAPWLGRWISSDPAGPADGSNLFAYARNNPISRVDPSGTESESKDDGYRDAGAGPTDVSGAGAQQANAPTSTQDTYSPSPTEGKTITPYDLPDAKIAGAVGAGGLGMIPNTPPPGGGMPPTMIDPSAGARYAPGASGGGPVTAPGAAGAGESAIAPGAAGSTETAIAPGATGTAEEVIAPGAAEGTEMILGRVLTAGLGAAAVIITAGATIPGDSPLPESTTPTSAELDAAFMRIAQREEARLREAVRKWDFSLIAAYRPGAMKAILERAQSDPWAALVILHKAYGKTLEMMIDDALQTDDVTSGYFEYLGGKNQADWRRLDGVLYDVCTTDTVPEHRARFYGEHMRIYPHQGLPEFNH